MKDFIAFIFSKQFVKHAALIFLAFVLFIFLLSKWFGIYTQHGDSLTLNDLNELTFDQAKELLESKGLDYYIVDSVSPSSWRPEYLPLAVLRQDPAPNSRVKQGRTVYLWLNPSSVPEYKIPCLTGNATLEEAFQRLPQVGMQVGDITYKALEELKEGNPILEMSIAGVKLECGAKAKYGARVDLLVGEKAGANKVSVPLLLGLTMQEAEFMLNSDLNFGTILYQSEGLIDSSSAVIYMQKPDYGADAVRIGSTVDIWLQQDLPEEVSLRISSLKKDTLIRE
ncbi:MAG: PASTA domain-containing protein [Chitinophagales bacterium]|nr:PASTA domain-containing protein [Chitinophagales bacterium]